MMLTIFPFCWARIVLRPMGLAWTKTSVSQLGSKYAVIWSDMRASLRFCSEASWVAVHSQGSFFFVSVESGAVIDAKFGINRTHWLASPRRDLTLVGLDGGVASLMLATFWGSGDIPSPENTYPRYVSNFYANTHWALFNVSPFVLSLFRTLKCHWLCSLSPLS